MVNRIFDKLLPPRRPRPPRLLTALAIWLIAISILPIVIGSANLAGLYLARNEGNAWLIPLLFFSTLPMSYWMMVFIVVLPVIGLAYIISGFFLLTGSRTAYWMTLILLGIGAIVNLFLVPSFISAIENIQNLPTVTDSSSFYSPLFFFANHLIILDTLYISC